MLSFPAHYGPIVTPLPRPKTAASVCVQPASELRHVQRHKHARHVLCASVPVPTSGRPRLARCLRPPRRPRRPRRPRLPCSRGPHLSPCIVYVLLLTRQFAHKFNQPLSFNSSKVTNMHSMFTVRITIHKPHNPAPNRQSAPPPGRCLRAAAHFAPYLKSLVSIGSLRRRSTSR